MLEAPKANLLSKSGNTLTFASSSGGLNLTTNFVGGTPTLTSGTLNAPKVPRVAVEVDYWITSLSNNATTGQGTAILTTIQNVAASINDFAVGDGFTLDTAQWVSQFPQLGSVSVVSVAIGPASQQLTVVIDRLYTGAF